VCFLKSAGENEIGASECADLKGARADRGESAAIVEVERAVIAVVDAEQKAIAAERASVGYGEIEECLGGTTVWMTSDRGRAEAREKIDAFEFGVSGVCFYGGKFRVTENGVANRRLIPGKRPSSSQCAAGVRLCEVTGVDAGNVILRAVCDEVAPGKHPCKGFEKCSSGNECECGSVGVRGCAQGDRFNIGRWWSAVVRLGRHDLADAMVIE